MTRKIALICTLTFFGAAALFAADIAPAFSREAIGAKSFPPPPRIVSAAAISPALSIGAADPTDIEEVRVWNAEGRRPVKNGFVRIMADLVVVRLAGAPASKGVIATSERGLVWSGRFQIAAHRVRLRLDRAKLPAGAVLWIYNDGGEPIAFDRDLLDSDGGLWTPSVGGGIVHLEVETPMPKSDADVASFEINRLLEIVPPLKTHDDPDCLIDVQCVGASSVADINSFKQGIAYLEYVKGNGGFVCSGGLLNDSTSSGTPWFLTANHCFDSQASATSLEAYWDWRFASCSSTAIPNPPTAGRTLGATLLATNGSSDFTFVRLSSIPANRYFFGSSTATVPAGTLLHRVSHPAPDDFGPLPQMYSASTVNTVVGQCQGRLRPNYLYSIFTPTQGGLYGGSSGSPVIAYLTGAPRVVGQLLGYCGQVPADGCDTRNSVLDGAFSATFASISQFLSATPAGCTPTATAMCLNNDRFKVEATYQTGSGQTGQGQVVKLTGDTGYLWFFNSSNVEVVIKVLNACGINGWWVFAGGLTDVRVTLTVTDTKTGSVKQYTNPLGQPFQPIQDTSAFSVCP
ncbi:MAG TPA: trypsin-like peptidase domain-containing protein [Thermoanaerobaculia bacterium]|nr:trypsin-like peptidase domain-containing protein [Thermoanaerobaculia bacterium]